MTFIEDGSGKGYKQKVDSSQRAWTRGVVNQESVFAAEDGRAYNINTGTISITGSSDSALLYLLNDEDKNIHISGIAIGLGAATQSDMAQITIVENPTGGDIISDASPVAMNRNRNFGSPNSLKTTTLVYKGKDGGTVTGGNDAVLLYAKESSRLLASIDLVIPKGKSIGIKIDPNLSSGSINLYAALILHLENGS